MLSTTLDKLEEMYKTEGLQEGKLQKSYDIAKNLLKEGSEPEFVSKVTGLTLDEVKKL